MLNSLITFATLATGALAHVGHDQTPIAGPHKALWYNTLPGDGGTQVGQLSCKLLAKTSNSFCS
jgi:agmatinase